MALPPCFHLADSVFPRVRAAAATRLVRAGWSQTRTAEALGVSQGMISRYLAQDAAEGDPLVLRMTDDLVLGLHQAPAAARSVWCDLLAPTGSGADEALQDLLSAEQRLLRHNPLAIVPQIGLNLARAAAGAAQTDQVLSYPARIVAAGNRLVNPAPPAYGASGHLARWLIRVHARRPDLLAAASIRGGPDMARAATRLGLEPLEVRREAGAGGDVDGPVLAVVDGAPAPWPGAIAAVHDPGAFGIEPCFYVGGHDARSVVEVLLRLNESLVTT